VSRSSRKPFTAVTGTRSAHDDKKTAARRMRCKQNAWFGNLKDFKNVLIPNRLECSFNNNFLWNRDEYQFLTFPYNRHLGCAELASHRRIRLHRKGYRTFQRNGLLR
jgi:hypothetical protein